MAAHIQHVMLHEPARRTNKQQSVHAGHTRLVKRWSSEKCCACRHWAHALTQCLPKWKSHAHTIVHMHERTHCCLQSTVMPGALHPMRMSTKRTTQPTVLLTVHSLQHESMQCSMVSYAHTRINASA